jgi:hypothetical protein
MQNITFSLEQFKLINEYEEGGVLSLVQLVNGCILPFTQSGSDSDFTDHIYLGDGKFFDSIQLDNADIENVKYIVLTSKNSQNTLDRLMNVFKNRKYGIRE